MATQSTRSDQVGTTQSGSGSADLRHLQSRVFEAAGLDPESRHIELEEPAVSVHVNEITGSDDDRPPAMLLHSGGSLGASFAPLMTELGARRMLVVDRPGYGQSGDFVYTPRNYRGTAISVIDGVLDALDIGTVDLIGNSAGAYWSLAYALAHPGRVRRVSLLGSVPTFPGTTAPMPLRLFTLALLSRVVARLQTPDEDAVIELYKRFGEGNSIQDHPTLIEALVAQDRTARANTVSTSEFPGL